MVGRASRALFYLFFPSCGQGHINTRFIILKCTVQRHQYMGSVVQLLPPSSSRTFSSAPKDPPPAIISRHSLSCPPQPLASTHLLSVSLDVLILESSHKRDHTVCGFLCLASLTEHEVVQLPSCRSCVTLHLFLRLNTILLCG